MRLGKNFTRPVDADLTPMIDMTFQLIAFFMVLINFTDAEQDERIKLPSSVLAKPPDAPLEEPLFLQLTKTGTVIFGTQEYTLEGLQTVLRIESQALTLINKSPAEATIVIRADADAATGEVQKLIQICQEMKFERFALRAKEEVRY